jgi:hypothetical protein
MYGISTPMRRARSDCCARRKRQYRGGPDSSNEFASMHVFAWMLRSMT